MKFENKEAFLKYLYEYYLIEIEDMNVTVNNDIERYEGKLNSDDDETTCLATFNTITNEATLLEPTLFFDDEE